MENSGFTNHISHVLSCCFAKSKEQMIEAYWIAKVSGHTIRKKQSAICGFFPTSSGGANKAAQVHIMNAKDKELFSFVAMIIMANWPLSPLKC